MPHQLVMSCVSILIRGTILTQTQGKEVTASWGQGITSSPKEGLASGELVTWRSQPKTVPIPLEEAKQTPLGQVWGRAGDELSQLRPPSASLGGSCSRALVCQEGQARKVTFSGHILGTRPDASPMTSSLSSTLSY